MPSLVARVGLAGAGRSPLTATPASRRGCVSRRSAVKSVFLWRNVALIIVSGVYTYYPVYM